MIQTASRGDTCVTTPPASPQVTALHRHRVTRGDTFRSYRRNRAHAHTRTPQPICKYASHVSPAVTRSPIPTMPTGGPR